MVYMKWTAAEFASLRQDSLYTEVDDDGWVQRELLVTPEGAVSQSVPSTEDPGWFGLVRLSACMLASNVSRREFETLWNRDPFQAKPV